MRDEPGTGLRPLAGLALLLALAAAVWWGLDRLELRPNWLQVEAPRVAVVGQPLPFRVHLMPLKEPTRLCADIHGGTRRDAFVKYLATGGSKPVGKEGGSFDFEIIVPSRPELRFLAGVFYLSPTGDWHDHTLAAGTMLIPVSGNPGGKVVMRLEPLTTQPSGGGNTNDSHVSAAPRWLTALLFLFAAALAWRGSLSGRGDRWWRMLVIAIALASLWELFGLESWLTSQARTIARASDLYYPRAIFQRAVVSLAIVGSISFWLFIPRLSRSRRLPVIAFALYAAIALVNLVSWHPIDQIADRSWHGLTVVQTLKLGCAAFTLLGVRRAEGATRTNP